MQLLKVYDMTIQYHPGKANVVAGALNRKTVSMGILTYLSVTKSPLANEIQNIEDSSCSWVSIEEVGCKLDLKLRPPSSRISRSKSLRIKI